MAVGVPFIINVTTFTYLRIQASVVVLIVFGPVWINKNTTVVQRVMLILCHLGKQNVPSLLAVSVHHVDHSKIVLVGCFVKKIILILNNRQGC